jgi:hypothetical protein
LRVSLAWMIAMPLLTIEVYTSSVVWKAAS